MTHEWDLVQTSPKDTADTNAVFLDTETTGLVDPEVVSVYAFAPTDGGAIKTLVSQAFKPSKPIEIGAMATHGISNASVAQCPEYDVDSLPFLNYKYAIGHNIQFDLQALKLTGRIKTIDTMALAHLVFPDAKSYSLKHLAFLIHDEETACRYVNNSHSAFHDALMMFSLYKYCCRALNIIPLHYDCVYHVCEEYRLRNLKIMQFGRNKGASIETLTSEYLQELLTYNLTDPDFRKVVEEELAKREEKIMILGIGMTGPQRTGKTTFAKQLSLVNNIKFIELNTGRSIQQAGVDPKQEVDIDTRLSLQRMLLTNFADTLRHNTAPFLTDRTPIDYASYMLADITRTVQVDEVLNFVDLCVEYTKRHYHKIFLFGPSPITNVEVDTSASINKAFMLHYYHICRSLLSETGVKVIPVNKSV